MKTETCNLCNGNGRIENYVPVSIRRIPSERSYMDCPGCFGKGTVEVVEPVTECPRCLGAGWLPADGMLCPACHGSGWLDAL